MSSGFAHPATRETFFVRQRIMMAFGKDDLSAQEMNYIDTRWRAYDDLLKSKSASELIMKLSIYQLNF